MTVKLYPHQEKAVGNLANGKILCGDVGTGKSITSIAYYVRRETPRDIYIITTARKRDSLDWDGEAVKYGIGKETSVPGMGKLTVDSWNNISKYVNVHGAFFIFDEQRLVGSGAWVKAFLNLARKNRWILLSATPGDTWLDYIPVFVANGFYKNKTEFKRKHVLYEPYSKFPKIKGYLEVERLERLRDMLLVDMPYLRTTVRNEVEIKVEHDKDLLKKVLKDRWHVYEERPLKTVAEQFIVMRKVVNSDASRLMKLCKLMEKHDKIIVFYNFDYELDILREAAAFWDVWYNPDWKGPPEKSGRKAGGNGSGKGVGNVRGTSSESVETTFETREWNGHKHEEVPTSDRWLYLVQYTSGAEAWNCVTTNVVTFFSQNYSFRILQQSKGRIDRLNTPFKELYYYTFMSDTLIDKGIKSALKSKKNFNERDFVISVMGSNPV